MTKRSKLTHSVDSAASSVAQTEASEIRKRAEDLAKELVGNVQFYETQERWGCFDIAKGWPEVITAPHTKHGRLKRVLTASLVPKIEAALRLSEDAARSSEARPGVGEVVEGTTADEKGSREPEKLNNAQKCVDCNGRGYSTASKPMGGYGHQNVECWTCKGTGKVALAESSLSSNDTFPPKTITTPEPMIAGDNKTLEAKFLALTPAQQEQALRRLESSLSSPPPEKESE